MPVTSNRSIVIGFTGEVEYSQTFPAAVSSLGSGQIQVVDLSSGNNTITVPDDAVAVTIVPETGNTAVITLKGVNGDMGIILSPVDPCSLSLDGVTSFVLNVSGAVTVRLIFS